MMGMSSCERETRAQLALNSWQPTPDALRPTRTIPESRNTFRETTPHFCAVSRRMFIDSAVA